MDVITYSKAERLMRDFWGAQLQSMVSAATMAYSLNRWGVGRGLQLLYFSDDETVDWPTLLTWQDVADDATAKALVEGDTDATALTELLGVDDLFD